MGLKWDDLRVFLAAHVEGSFSAAARTLRSEQSTVSRRIASLEDALGGPLFLRHRTGLVLTERGERILPLATEASERIQELASLSLSQRVEGTVRLALTESMAVYGLARLLDELFDKWPALRVKLVTGMNMSDLGRREADLALRFVQPIRGDLVSKCVAHLPSGLWAHRRWAQRPWDELEWVELDVDAVPNPAGSWIRRHAGRPSRLVTNGFIDMVEAVHQGVGVGILPDTLGQRRPDLVRIEPPAPLPQPTRLFLVTHRASRHVPKIAAMWDFLEENGSSLTVG